MLLDWTAGMPETSPRWIQGCDRSAWPKIEHQSAVYVVTHILVEVKWETMEDELVEMVEAPLFANAVVLMFVRCLYLAIQPSLAYSNTPKMVKMLHFH